MPGVATTALVWKPEQDQYEFRGQGKVPRPLSAKDEEQWQALLQACDSCSFQGQSGHLTLRKEDERSEEHTSELQSHLNLVCRLLLEKKKRIFNLSTQHYRHCSLSS